MRGLTVTQPWAQAIALGLKRYETRSWHTAYRGPLAIHAATNFPAYAREFAATELANGRLPARFPTGAIVALCELVECHPARSVVPSIGAVERLYGDFSDRRFAWKLRLVREFLAAPVPARGMLGLWAVPDELAARLTAGAAA